MLISTIHDRPAEGVRAQADRVGLIIDAQAYYEALSAAFERARHSIYILGWTFDPRARLAPDGFEGPDDPDEVGHVLIKLAKARPELDVRLLIWDAALPISAGHNGYPQRGRRWFADTSIKFELDGSVPFGACHHQKLVVVDDNLAFCGGGDIAPGRWDSQHHLHHEPRRLLPHRAPHLPRHDVMMLVDGPAAALLGGMFRERWRTATGADLATPPTPGAAAWPLPGPPPLTAAPVHIARTLPSGGGRPAVNEIRRLTLARIANARRSILLENQYFTSREIADALAARLREDDGPEVLLISTLQSPSWFDRITMDTARAPLIQDLRRADLNHRFRAVAPRTAQQAPIIVHSKTSVFDDEILCVGSANLNNRSAGFDSELEIAVSATDDDARGRIRSLRNHLIGHFVGVTGEVFAAAERDAGGLVAAVDRFTGPRLTTLAGAPSWIGHAIGALRLGDPRSREENWKLRFRRPHRRT